MWELTQKQVAAATKRGNELDARGYKRSKFWTVNDEPSMTIQSDGPAADIKNILAHYTEVGIVQNLNKAEAMFLDVTQFDDFTDAMRHAKLAEAEFMKLPSKVREVFHHSVEEWLDAAFDPEKRDALVAKGDIKGVDNSSKIVDAGDKGGTGEPDDTAVAGKAE